MNAQCLSQAYAQAQQTFLPAGLGSTLTSMLVLAFALAILAAPFLVLTYDRNVRRLMRMREILPVSPTRPKTEALRESEALNDSPQNSTAAAAAGPDSGGGAVREARQRREQRVRQATFAAYVVFVALTGLVVPLARHEHAADRVGLFVLSAVSAGFPALTLTHPQGLPRTLLAGVGILVAGVLLWQVAQSANDPDPLTLEDALYTQLAVAMLYLASVHRLRPFVLPNTVLISLALAAFIASMFAYAPLMCLGDGSTPAAGEVGAARSLVLTSVLTGALVISGLLGLKLLDALAALQERGLFSDVSLIALFGVSMTAVLATLGLGHEPVSYVRAALTAAAWIGATATAYAVAMRSTSAPPDVSRSLLVLRVFSNDLRAERLLDVVQGRWRFVGPVRQIAGPDLARLNLDLYRYLKFATFRMAQMFLPGSVPAEEILARLHRRIDRDGRFHVSEVFCFDSAWRGAVEQLVRTSDAILLDIRGFTRARGGTAFEIGLLARLDCLGKVVAVGDATTDWNAFDALTHSGVGGQVLGARLTSGGRRLESECFETLLEVATNRQS